MKNYLNFETDIKNLESEIEKLKDPFNEEGLSEVDTKKISEIQEELDCRPCGLHGLVKCPEKHFKCANNILIEDIVT